MRATRAEMTKRLDGRSGSTQRRTAELSYRRITLLRISVYERVNRSESKASPSDDRLQQVYRSGAGSGTEVEQEWNAAAQGSHTMLHPCAAQARLQRYMRGS